jgi:hypothetical protein
MSATGGAQTTAFSGVADDDMFGFIDDSSLLNDDDETAADDRVRNHGAIRASPL